MKKILAVAALAAMVASPALAQTIGSYESNSMNWRVPRTAAQSYAAVDEFTGYPYAGPTTAISNGHIVGADPDPNVRLELMRASPLFAQ